MGWWSKSRNFINRGHNSSTWNADDWETHLGVGGDPLLTSLALTYKDKLAKLGDPKRTAADYNPEWAKALGRRMLPGYDNPAIQEQASRVEMGLRAIGANPGKIAAAKARARNTGLANQIGISDSFWRSLSELRNRMKASKDSINTMGTNEAFRTAFFDGGGGQQGVTTLINSIGTQGNSGRSASGGNDVVPLQTENPYDRYA